MFDGASVLLGLVIVAFGQPAFFPVLGILASLFGYALFWRVLIKIPSFKKRFLYGTAWFAVVQAVQLSWLLSHPYAYIYGLYLFLIVVIGMQFGWLSALITRGRIEKWTGILSLAGLYTLLEWSRLYILSGFSFNPIGLALTSTLWGLQNASLGGVFGLTFFVLFVNLIFLRFFEGVRSIKTTIILVLAACAPYIFGAVHIQVHRPEIVKAASSPSTTLNALLVQTAFPVEEALQFSSFQEAVHYVEEEWRQILKVLQGHVHDKVDLVVLPEYVVPYGTYMAIFPYAQIKNMFADLFGDEAIKALPPLQEPLAMQVETTDGLKWAVTNAFFCQAIANLFQSDVVAGLQDDQWIDENTKQSYSSAFYFWPGASSGFRYEKRVLLPLGEYIPFEFCKNLAKAYGVTGSFCPGKEAKVFPGCKVPFGLSICYEETYGNLMLESRAKGSLALINLTSDVWYPNSRLPKQHFDHARLRTVEAGIPLLRACNTGITCAVDSLGEIVGSLHEEDEWVRQGLLVPVPLYSYKTLYALLGDSFIIGFSFMVACFLIKKSA